VLSICAERQPVLVWPDDVASRAFFSGPGERFIPGRTAEEAVRALGGNEVADVFCIYSPTCTIQAEREADCRLLREADEIVSRLAGGKVLQPARLDPLGDIPIWQQVWNTFRPGREAVGLPWFRPGKAPAVWARAVLAGEFPGWAEGDPVVIVSPFSGAPKKAVPDGWWREFAAGRADVPMVAPVYGEGEMEKGRGLFAGTTVRVMEADLEQIIALGAMPNSEVIGVDGGRLNLLAASRAMPVQAFYGIWPASAWALPNVEALPLNISSNFQPST
jgi:hypothetical protein